MLLRLLISLCVLWVGRYCSAAVVYGPGGSGIELGLRNIIEDITPQLGANLDGQTFSITTSGALSAGAITGTSFVIGGNTLDTNEWAFLDGLNQSVATGDSVVFAGISLGDDQLIQFGAAQDYTTQWDGDDAVHTISAGDFVFSGGNVGIGTATPDKKLFIQDSTGAYLLTNSDSNAGIVLRNSGNTDGNAIGIAFELHDVDGNFKGSSIRAIRASSAGTELAFTVSDASTPIEAMRIDTDGNVGIGTTGPGQKLEVKSGNILVKGFLADEQGYGIVFDDGGGDTDFWISRIDFDGDGGSDNDRLSIGDGTVIGTNEFVSIKTDGNVGIGLIAPRERTEILDKTGLALESLTDGDFAAYTNWTAAGDFVEGEGSDYDYIHSGGTGTLTQASGDLARAGAGFRWYKLQYTISNQLEAGALVARLTTAFAATTLTLDVGSNGTKTHYFLTDNNPGDFVISVTSTTVGDEFTIDDVTLKEVTGGDLIVNGMIQGGGNVGIKIDGDGTIRLGTDDQKLYFGNSNDLSIMVSEGVAVFNMEGSDHFEFTGGELRIGDGTNETRVSAAGNQTFSGSAGFYPRVVSQDGKPAAGTGATQCDSGEYMMWIDTNDSNKVYGVYNNGGTVVAVLMAL